MRITRPISRSARRGFTLVEIMMVVLILSIIGVLGIDAVASFEAHQRADRAARESLSLFRVARSLAMSTGKNCKIRISSATTPSVATIGVYLKAYGATSDAYDYTQPYASGMTNTNTLVLNLNASKELVGATISPTGTTDYEFNSLGTCTTTGTVTFSYGGRNQTITVKKVGDPTIP
jgi:prepilin-type N-terminal cleavage/methylation domain-containing protein